MFSIITITYNNLDGLKKTAGSVLAQTSSEYEWIIIDGASKDGTIDYLGTLNALKISEPDQGIYDAMNKGLELAKRDYLIFMNAGDTFAGPDVLENLKDIAVKQHYPDFIFGPALEERDGQEPILKSARKADAIHLGMITHHQAMIYKTALCKDLNYNTAYHISADYDFTCRFLNKTKSTYRTDFPVCLFESGGVSQTSVKLGRDEQYRIREQLNMTSPLINSLIYFLQKTAMFLRQRSPSLYWALRGRQKP